MKNNSTIFLRVKIIAYFDLRYTTFPKYPQLSLLSARLLPPANLVVAVTVQLRHPCRRRRSSTPLRKNCADGVPITEPSDGANRV